VAALLPLSVVTLMAACGGTGPSGGPGSSSNASAVKPTQSFPAPAGLLAGGPPQPNGFMWLLARAKGAATLQELNLTSGRITTIVPESLTADSVTQASTGVVAVGLATATTGALELRNGSSGALVSTVPLGAPVRSVAAGSDGSTFYVLNRNSTSASVTLVNATTGHPSGSVPVPLDTATIAVPPAGADLLALSPSGKVAEVDLGTGKVVSEFPVGPNPLSLALSNTGTTLYVLKSVGAGTNVGVISLATQRQTTALPAPANCVGIQVSLDGKDLYDLVGTDSYGNVQVFPLSP